MMIRSVTVRTGLRGRLVLQVVAEQEWCVKGHTTNSDDVNIVTRDATVNDLPELIERGFLNRLGLPEQT